MKNQIEHLEIKNFKSIKHIKFDCKRINIFIGKPNVGKSNVLEALSLFIAPYLNLGTKFLADYIRYENLRNLFYDNDRTRQIAVNSNLGFGAFIFQTYGYQSIFGPEIGLLEAFSKDANKGNSNYDESIINNYSNKISHKTSRYKPFYASMREDGLVDRTTTRYDTFIRKYHFKSLENYNSHLPSFLSPPYGDNLYSILEANPKYFEEYSAYFNEYKLDLLLDVEKEKLDIQKRVGKRVYKIPYSLTADTLRRYIFFMLAIETNKDSILLFEEPEAHCFPPYIKEFAQRVIDSEDNQFFITTHSPFVLNTVLENADKKDVAVFVLEYKNYQTNIKALSDKELSNMLNYGYDIFSTLK